MRLNLQAPPELAAVWRTRLPKALAAEASAAMERATVGLKLDLRAQTLAAGLGARMGNTWRHAVYPVGRPALGPAGTVWTNAPEPMKAFADGATIRSKTGGWLAIPTPETRTIRGAGLGGSRRERITPGGFERATGLKLRLVSLGPRRAVLVTGGRPAAGKRGLPVRPLSPTARRRGAASTLSYVAFVLVPQARINARLDVDAAAARAQAVLAASYAAGADRAFAASLSPSSNGA